MADIAAMPEPKARPKNWLIYLHPQARVSTDIGPDKLPRAKLHSTAEGWIKFLRDDGRIVMYCTQHVLCVVEEAPE